MVITLGLVLALLGLACLIAAAFGVAARVQLLPLGLAFWLLSQLVR